MQQGNQTFAVGMQEAEIARTPKPLRQHMQQHQPQELRAGDGAPLTFPGLRIAIPESHLVVCTGEDIRLADDAPVFGWSKTVGPLRKARFVGLAKVKAQTLFTF